MSGRKYYEHYEDIYAAALTAGVDSFNNPLNTEIMALINNPALPPSGKVLDLGCGEGLYSLLFASRGFEVVGIDISPSAVKWAQARADREGLPQTRFIVGDTTQLAGLSDDTFDLVLNIHCYHCLTEPDDRSAHLKATYRVLKPGGVLLFDNMAAPSPEDLPQFRSWHTSRKGQIKEDETGITTTVQNTPAYTIQRKAGPGAIEFEIQNAVALAHRFYSRLDQIIIQLRKTGFEILSAELRTPDPARISDMKFIQGDNVILARKPNPLP